jgi:hypothetical protein
MKGKRTTAYSSILPRGIAADVVRWRGDGSEPPADDRRLDLLDGLRDDVWELVWG